jgi:hypothetical protein
MSLNPLTLLHDAADFRAVRFEYRLGFDSNPTVIALAATFRVIEIAVLNQFLIFYMNDSTSRHVQVLY